MAVSDEPALVTIAALLVTGGGKVAFDFYKAWKEGPPKELRAVSLADANLALVAKARDELIEDIIRLRAELLEKDARHAADRTQWLADQERLRADVARLEQQIRVERADANKRYDDLLQQIKHLGQRTNIMEERRDG
jgi:hypothetical protein